MDIASLDALLSEYGGRIGVPPSRVGAADLQALEAELQMTLPPDFKDLALRYDLAALEVHFSHFSPSFATARGLAGAWRAAYDKREVPFADAYRQWGVLPVGDDWSDLQLLMAVRDSRASTPPGTQQTYLPYGSIWAFDREDRTRGLEFASSSFSQAVHGALLLQGLKDPLMSGKVTVDEAVQALEAVDPAIRGHPYWRRWARSVGRIRDGHS
jgi:hypothetical protein